jgi:hypothetical protein
MSTTDAGKIPNPEYSVRIGWTSDPARVEALVACVFEEIDTVKNTFIFREWMGRIRDVLLREHQDNIRENGFGTLDTNSLSEVTDALEALREDGDRLIGIISHRPELTERLPGRILVEKGVGESR